jgi:2-oxoisovalerate dehydrogenase E1 component alpha subunit
MKRSWSLSLPEDRVLFPGALNSEFTNTLDFLRPSTSKAIPTYRVLNQYGEVVDKSIGVETEDNEALTLYKNMVRCMLGRKDNIGIHDLIQRSEHHGSPHV